MFKPAFNYETINRVVDRKFVCCKLNIVRNEKY